MAKRFVIQISSGRGPAECELAVGLFTEHLAKEFPEMKILEKHRSGAWEKLPHSKLKEKCFNSVLVEIDLEDSQDFCGSILWICKSLFRPKHGRKNWFIDVSKVKKITDEKICLDENDIRMERFHCGGNGGQNVNKVETGVRLIHIPTGISVTATEERSQHLNRAIAMRKLEERIREKIKEENSGRESERWEKHCTLERGNPIRVYEGMGFRQRHGEYNL
ncbi:MAG: peptide chain release factor H [Treponema sp.]|nr:peptide chain release factor H [Treponema sp.]